MFAWRQVKFMGLCGKKEEERIYEIVYREI